MGSIHHIVFIIISIAALSSVYVFFSFASASISRAKLPRLLSFSDNKKCCVKYAQQILEKPDPYLISTQLARFISVLLIGFALWSLIASDPAVNWIKSITGEESAAMGVDILGVFAVCFVSFAVFFSLQIVRDIASSGPEKILCTISPIIHFTFLILSPLIFFVDQMAGGFLRRLGFKFHMRPELSISSQDINEVLELGAESGAIHEEEKEMIQSVFSFGDTVVREVMTPRQDIIFVDISSTFSHLLKTIINTGVSRVVVVGKNLDDVRGVIHVKDLLPYFDSSKEPELKKLMRVPLIVPNTRKAGDLMNEFKELGIHLAVVVDEHGGVDGIVTMEDLVEEIVGEVFDEYDIPDNERPVCKTKHGDFLVDGTVLVEDLNNHYGFNLPEGSYETVAGFVIDKLGHIPAQGESIDYEGVLIKVEKISHNKIDLLRLVVPRRVGQLKVVKGNGASPVQSRSHDGPRVGRT